MTHCTIQYVIESASIRYDNEDGDCEHEGNDYRLLLLLFISIDTYRITHPLDMESGYNNTECVKITIYGILVLYKLFVIIKCHICKQSFGKTF